MSYPLKTGKTIGIFPFEKRGEVLGYMVRPHLWSQNSLIKMVAGDGLVSVQC